MVCPRFVKKLSASQNQKRVLAAGKTGGVNCCKNKQPNISQHGIRRSDCRGSTGDS